MFEILAPLPLTRNIFFSSSAPSIWISNTNKSHLFDLFELHHAVRRRWVAQSEGSWNYRVKILMERSQSLWRWSQRIMLIMLCSPSYILATQAFLFRVQVEWAMEYILFSSTACVRLEFCSVAGRGRPQLFISYWTALSEPMHVNSFA